MKRFRLAFQLWVILSVVIAQILIVQWLFASLFREGDIYVLELSYFSPLESGLMVGVVCLMLTYLISIGLDRLRWMFQGERKISDN